MLNTLFKKRSAVSLAAVILGLQLVINAANAQTPTLEWVTQFGTTGADIVNGVVTDGAGNIYVVGQTTGALPGQVNLGSNDAFVQKYDSSGALTWTQEFGTTASDIARGVSVDSGGVYISGDTAGTLPGQASAGGTDAFITKYDTSGTLLWTSQFGSTSTDIAQSVS